MHEVESLSPTKTPIVSKPDLAKDNAVGRPILPIPITQTRNVFDSKDFVTSSRLFMVIFGFDIDITDCCILNLFLPIIIL